MIIFHIILGLGVLLSLFEKGRDFLDDSKKKKEKSELLTDEIEKEREKLLDSISKGGPGTVDDYFTNHRFRKKRTDEPKKSETFYIRCFREPME